MLTYLFWHWSQPQVDAAEYIANLIAFHQVLNENGPEGFHYSAIARVEGFPWGNPTGPTYQDWHIVDKSAALDPLNEKAVGPVCRPTHDVVARQAADGVGSLYQFHSGDESVLVSHNRQTWFSKPTGVSYAAFFEGLAPLLTRPGVALWQRQMNLGPTPEFCLLSEGAFTLPEGVTGRYFLTQLLWSGAK